MERGVVPPCPELGDEPEHRLLWWLGGQASKDGLIKLGQDKIFYRAGRDTGADEQSFQALEDAGYVEKVSVGESYRYRVLVFCVCQGGNPRKLPPALRREPIFGAQRLMGEQWLLGVGGSRTGVKSESVQKSVVVLANDFFPEVVRGAGIQMTPLQTNGPALVRHLRSWKAQGVDIETMELMMEEFAQHPEWCRRSRKPPWQVFVGRRGELDSIVAFRKRKDPVRRRWSDGTWFTRHTPRAISTA